jgi:hypothetical protein
VEGVSVRFVGGPLDGQRRRFEYLVHLIGDHTNGWSAGTTKTFDAKFTSFPLIMSTVRSGCSTLFASNRSKMGDSHPTQSVWKPERDQGGSPELPVPQRLSGDRSCPSATLDVIG